MSLTRQDDFRKADAQVDNLISDHKLQGAGHMVRQIHSTSGEATVNEVVASVKDRGTEMPAVSGVADDMSRVTVLDKESRASQLPNTHNTVELKEAVRHTYKERESERTKQEKALDEALEATKLRHELWTDAEMQRAMVDVGGQDWTQGGVAAAMVRAELRTDPAVRKAMEEVENEPVAEVNLPQDEREDSVEKAVDEDLLEQARKTWQKAASSRKVHSPHHSGAGVDIVPPPE